MDLLNFAAQHLLSGHLQEAESLCRLIQETSPKEVGVYYLLVLIANKKKEFEAAVGYADTAIEMKAGVAEIYLEKGRALAGLGKIEKATESLWTAVGLMPDVPEGYGLLSSLLMPGDIYYRTIEQFHEWLKPRSYLEIGVANGASLARAMPPTVAVGIDPAPHVTAQPRTTAKVRAMTSDDYFASGDPRADMECDIVDLAFIDGLHLFEQALRDFINVEKLAGPDTVVLFHDCLPVDALTAERVRKTGFWSGDVWKVIAALIKWRPDLDVFTVAARPTGLGVVTGLDPSSTVLADNYDAIVQEFMPQGVDPDRTRRWRDLRMVENDWDKIQNRVAAARGQGA